MVLGLKGPGRVGTPPVSLMKGPPLGRPFVVYVLHPMGGWWGVLMRVCSLLSMEGLDPMSWVARLGSPSEVGRTLLARVCLAEDWLRPTPVQ